MHLLRREFKYGMHCLQYVCINGYVTTTYFGPRQKEKIFPCLFVGLIQNSAKSFISFGKNGSEPMIGSEGRPGGNL